MIPTPQSLAIFLALFCGIAVSHSQSPSDQAFLTERFAVTTHSGVTGLPPGTALHVVSQNGNTFRVTAAGSTLPFDVPKAKLTTDANFAARLAQDDYAAQGAAGQLSAQQMEADRQTQAAKRAEQDVGYFVPEGGGPVIPATPENLARFGPPVHGTGANAARAVQAQVDRELAAARQQQALHLQHKAAARQAAEQGRLRQTAGAAASQRAQDDQRIDRENRRNLENMQRQSELSNQQQSVEFARARNAVIRSAESRENYNRELQQLNQLREQQRWDGNRATAY